MDEWSVSSVAWLIISCCIMANSSLTHSLTRLTTRYSGLIYQSLFLLLAVGWSESLISPPLKISTGYMFGTQRYISRTPYTRSLGGYDGLIPSTNSDAVNTRP